MLESVQQCYYPVTVIMIVGWPTPVRLHFILRHMTHYVDDDALPNDQGKHTLPGALSAGWSLLQPSNSVYRCVCEVSEQHVVLAAEVQCPSTYCTDPRSPDVIHQPSWLDSIGDRLGNRGHVVGACFGKEAIPQKSMLFPSGLVHRAINTTNAASSHVNSNINY